MHLLLEKLMCCFYHILLSCLHELNCVIQKILSFTVDNTNLISCHWRRKTVGEPAAGRAGNPGGRRRLHPSCSLSCKDKISILKSLAAQKVKSRAEHFCKLEDLSSLLKERRPAGHEPRLSGEPQKSHQDEENAGDHLWVAETQKPQREVMSGGDASVPG